MRNNLTAITLILIIAILFVSGCDLVSNNGGDSESIDNNTPYSDNASEAGTIIIEQQTVPSGQAGSFQFTGVPTGTISGEATLVVSDLEPGTYSTTERNPAPDFDLTAVDCDDSGSVTPSSGDPSTRTAVINLDPQETVTCTFTNSRRGSLVIASQTNPEGSGGSFQFTGVPSGTIPANGTLVVSNLTPGTYSSTEVDPAPDFDLTAVDCDDGSSQSPSSGDPSTRTAIFNLDPGELVTCTFSNTRRGSLVIASQTVPDGSGGSFQFTGVPSGTVSGNSTLVASNLTPGTYTSTEVDPAPDFELTAVDCDDSGSATPSSGDASTRTAVFNLDPGETVSCKFTNTQPGAILTPTITAGGASGVGEDTSTGGDQPSGGDASPGGGINPFENPDGEFDNFPLPDDPPPVAGTYNSPKPGPWSVTHYAGQMNCGSFSLSIPASPPESGILEILDGGQTVIGTGLEDAQGVSITLNAHPEINGRYTGTFQGIEQGVPVTIDYFWQVITDEHIVGYLTASVTSEGVSCEVYRPFEMFYTG